MWIYEWYKWRNWKLQYKLMIIYIPLIVLPSVVGLAILTNSYNQTSQEVISYYSKTIIDLTRDKIDTQISNYNDISLKLFTKSEIIRLFEDIPENQFERLGIQRQLEGNIRPAIGEIDINNIISCVFVTKSGRFVVGNDSADHYNDNEQTFIDNIEKSNGAPVWSNPREFRIGNREVQAFRLGRVIKDDNFQPIGIAYLVINSRWLQNTLTSSQVGSGVELAVRDSRDQVIIKKEMQLAKTSDNTLDIVAQIKQNDWSVFASFSLAELYGTVHRMSGFAVGLIVLCTVIGLVATYIFVTDLVIPIKRLRGNIYQGIKGVQPQLMIKFKGAREICELNDLFISFLYEIYNLVEDVKKNEKKKRKAELKLLQNQLSPHFLYNTLNSIRWMALIRKQDHIREMVDALTHLLTYSLHNADELVLLKDELSVMQDYVKIQKVRYQNFQFITHIEADLENVKILKFLLQPLIENALVHGLSNIDRPGEIKLSIKECNNQLLVQVIDNGMGISNERLSSIHEILAGKNENNHIGLRSVQERIQMYYGSEYGLQILSMEGSGTTMEIIMPLITDVGVQTHEESDDS
ncbi:cache domain-containing sensor histidine kinase [Paenibacillus kribbensis]|uniref:cache domain-containing sensor histidine kinase n=1 Tax=Paenibacillus kribbensis TaxID=172713 RepID=UPI000837B20A|nr:histidine kinase [Paenibacillus kribbensis]